MSQQVIKVQSTEHGDGLPFDTVENLLARVKEGHEIAVFTDTGVIVYSDENLDFEEIS